MCLISWILDRCGSYRPTNYLVVTRMNIHLLRISSVIFFSQLFLVALPTFFPSHTVVKQQTNVDKLETNHPGGGVREAQRQTILVVGLEKPRDKPSWLVVVLEKPRDKPSWWWWC